VKSVLAVDEVMDPAIPASHGAIRRFDLLVSRQGVQRLEFPVGIGKGALPERDDVRAAMLPHKRQDMLIQVQAIEKEADRQLGEGRSQPWQEPIEGLQLTPLQRDLSWPSVFCRNSVPREMARPLAHTSFASRTG